MTLENPEILRKYLPKGYAKTLANKFNLSVSQVNKIMNGQFINIPLMEEALELALENKQRLNNVKSKFNQLIKS